MHSPIYVSTEVIETRRSMAPSGSLSLSPLTRSRKINLRIILVVHRGVPLSLSIHQIDIRAYVDT